MRNTALDHWDVSAVKPDFSIEISRNDRFWHV
jgi:hypothetical protein